MKSREFLKFKGKDLYFFKAKDEFYVAYKPICDALKIDANRAYKNLQKHRVFSKELKNQPITVESNGSRQVRNMLCLPEKHIYLWIATLDSDNPDIEIFIDECAEVLFKYFRGYIGGRSTLLETRYLLENSAAELHEKLQELQIFKDYDEIKKQISALNKELKKNDSEILLQSRNLFNYDNEAMQVPENN